MNKADFIKATENTVNNTADAVSRVAQRAIAGKLREALSSDPNAINQIKAVYAVIEKLEKGELRYD